MVNFHFKPAFATPTLLPVNSRSSSSFHIRHSIHVPRTSTPRRLRSVNTSINHYNQPITFSLNHQHESNTNNWLRNIAASVTVLATLFVPSISHARGRKPDAITMTDQVPNFTLPSQERAVTRTESQNPLFIKAFKIAKTVLPVAAIVALLTWASKVLFRKAQDKKIRDFQTQLQSFSSMRDLDTSQLGTDPQASIKDAKTSAAKMMDNNKKYKFSTDQKKGFESEDVASKVRLDLFKAGGSTSSSPTEKADAQVVSDSTTQKPIIEEVIPETDFDKIIAQCISKAEGSDENSNSDALAEFTKAKKELGIGETEAQEAFDSYSSKVVSSQIDRAASNLNADDHEILQNLNQIAVTMSATKSISPEAQLKYSGSLSDDENGRELLYRRYAVFCLSSEDGGQVNVQYLDEMQRLLSVSDQRAEMINTEIAKGMFQIAVSAAMADGGVNDESREALDKMKDAFGDYLDGGSADSIMSEVAVMRAMYSLQQLLEEQGVSDEDVKELRKMCADLGVDIDEMLENADALGEALGPEAKEFVESLKGILRKSSDDASTTMVTTTAKPVDSTQSISGSSDSSE